MISREKIAHWTGNQFLINLEVHLTVAGCGIARVMVFFNCLECFPVPIYSKVYTLYTTKTQILVTFNGAKRCTIGQNLLNQGTSNSLMNRMCPNLGPLTCETEIWQIL